MSYFVTTALGHEVPLGDWQALHTDTILKVLYDFRANPLNRDNSPLGLEPLCSVTGLSAADVEALVASLASRGLMEIVPGEGYRIAADGILYVRNSPGQAMVSGSFR